MNVQLPKHVLYSLKLLRLIFRGFAKFCSKTNFSRIKSSWSSFQSRLLQPLSDLWNPQKFSTSKILGYSYSSFMQAMMKHIYLIPITGMSFASSIASDNLYSWLYYIHHSCRFYSTCIQSACRGQIQYTWWRHRKIAMRALDSWHVLYTSYDSTSPELSQKLKQSSEVRRRIDSLYSNVIFNEIGQGGWANFDFVCFWEEVAMKSLAAWVIT